MDCPYLDACPIFAKFSSEGLANIWISGYCKKNEGGDCERKKLKDGGKEVPITLLPNGTHLKSLAK
ncbi:MAG: hypothetical protein J7K81_01490 [Methanophagales archaeon]|nr:hypothetical protein [Methanophagales archaeon]